MIARTDAAARRPNPWRITGWTVAASLLLLPLLAMRVTDEVNWTAFDFIVFGAMLLIAGAICEAGVGMTPSQPLRYAIGLGAVAGFIVIWAILAAGLV